ncbi:MAG: hypothetical protein MPK08_01690 [Alphaproteobacteria bacterium]|nr:hypothetical protein [Alphaproteobacteria bacterium]MDA8012840.1 hypothetical protein [Alphaproteobacteria bacterium]
MRGGGDGDGAAFLSVEGADSDVSRETIGGGREWGDTLHPQGRRLPDGGFEKPSGRIDTRRRIG